jgi:hypothetical protein
MNRRPCICFLRSGIRYAAFAYLARHAAFPVLCSLSQQVGVWPSPHPCHSLPSLVSPALLRPASWQDYFLSKTAEEQELEAYFLG